MESGDGKSPYFVFGFPGLITIEERPVIEYYRVSIP